MIRENWKIFLTILIAIALSLGIYWYVNNVDSETGEEPKSKSFEREFIIYTECEDGVVCYKLRTSSSIGGCFKDEELEKKYCEQAGE